MESNQTNTAFAIPEAASYHDPQTFMDACHKLWQILMQNRGINEPDLSLARLVYFMSAPLTYQSPSDSARRLFHHKMLESFPMIDVPKPETKMTRLCFLFFGNQEVDPV